MWELIPENEICLTDGSIMNNIMSNLKKNANSPFLLSFLLLAYVGGQTQHSAGVTKSSTAGQHREINLSLDSDTLIFNSSPDQHQTNTVPRPTSNGSSSKK